MDQLASNLAAAVQIPPFFLSHPLPVAGVMDDYAPRQLCGIGGKGRNVPGVVSFPDPVHPAQDPVDPLVPSWELRNIPEILLLLDDDAAFKFYMDLVTRWRLSFTGCVFDFP